MKKLLAALVMSFALVVASGCASHPVPGPSNYCSLYHAEYWTIEAMDWLLDNDPEFYKTVIYNNELYERLCT